MQLPEDFWAFIYELNNPLLFQQKLMPALRDSDAQWYKFSGNVFCI